MAQVQIDEGHRDIEEVGDERDRHVAADVSLLDATPHECCRSFEQLRRSLMVPVAGRDQPDHQGAMFLHKLPACAEEEEDAVTGPRHALRRG